MAAKKGHIVSLETRKKISNSLSNERHFAWKNEANYYIVHYWLRRNFEKPKNCEKCGEEKKIDWALLKGKKYERKRENFIGLCRKCHIEYDHPEKLRKKPTCIDCGKQLKDVNASRCYSHAQKERWKNDISNLSYS